MEKIFLEILNMSLSGSLVILVVLIARLLLKKAPKWISCVLWGLVAVRLLCPFSIESALSLLPSAEPVPTDIAMMPRPEIDSGIPAINQVVNPVIERNFTPAPVASANPLQIINFFATWIWVIGIIILLAYAIVSYGLLYKKVKGSITFEDNIKLCDYIETPFILGVFKPIIYLPSGVSEEQFYHVIAHEKAHLKRLDHIWKPLGFLVLAIYWINPLVWISYALLCKDIEMACDEKVIADFDKKSAASYSKSLLECSVGRRNILMCPLAFGEVSVKERIKHVLNYKKPSFWVICVAAIVCVVVAICFLTNPKGTDVIEEQDIETVETVPGTDTNADMTYLDINKDYVDYTYEVNDSIEFVESWAKAFCLRDGEFLYTHSSENAIDYLEISIENGNYAFGYSSPWPWDENWFYIKEATDSYATIYYYALASDPHVWVWQQHISYEKDSSDEYVVKTVNSTEYENIVLGSEFDQAYNCGLLWMDYTTNTLGEVLNNNALLSSTNLYKDLFQPDTAARRLLNLLPNENKIPIEIMGGDSKNEKILNITFMEDNQTRTIKMVQPWGDEGIWIPQAYGEKGIREEELITHFLTMLYETNYNSRMTKFETLDDVEDYYSEFSTIVDEDCLEKMKNNREPYKYDNLYKDDPLTIETIKIEQMDEPNQYSYTVYATNNSGEINIKGSINVNGDGMITYFR